LNEKIALKASSFLQFAGFVQMPANYLADGVVVESFDIDVRDPVGVAADDVLVESTGNRCRGRQQCTHNQKNDE